MRERDYQPHADSAPERNGKCAICKKPVRGDGDLCTRCDERVTEAALKKSGFKLAGMKSYTYGVMPGIAEFNRAFERECPDGTYSIRNDKHGRSGDYTDDELWALLKEQVALWNDSGEKGEEAGDFTSAVLSTLGFEWI